MANYKMDAGRLAQVVEIILQTQPGAVAERIEDYCCQDWQEEGHQKWLNTAPVEEIADWIPRDAVYPQTVECIYCGADVEAVDEDFQSPAVDDDEAWTALAAQHRLGCEWIVTRAHRFNPRMNRWA